MVNIRRFREELGIPPESTQPTLNQASAFVSRSTVQSILDSAIQSGLKLALQSALDEGGEYILKSTIQSILELTIQPSPESRVEPVDTRPIWSGRPELI
jgi:hypothetical protein